MEKQILSELISQTEAGTLYWHSNGSKLDPETIGTCWAWRNKNYIGLVRNRDTGELALYWVPTAAPATSDCRCPLIDRQLELVIRQAGHSPEGTSRLHELWAACIAQLSAEMEQWRQKSIGELAAALGIL